MIDLLLVGVGFIVGLADTLGDDLRVAFTVASILAVRTLHTRSVLEEISTQRTAHDVVELLGDELVALLFVDLFLLLAHGALSVETNVEGTAILQLLGYSTISRSFKGLQDRAIMSHRSSSGGEYGRMAPKQTMNQSSPSEAHSGCLHGDVRQEAPLHRSWHHRGPRARSP